MTDTINASRSERIKSLDVLRGAAIIGVITVHILFGAGREVAGMSEFNYVELLYAGLPMFMVITGYLHKSGKDYVWNVKHRVIPLLVALVVSTIILTSIMFIYMSLIGYDLSEYNLVKDIAQIIIGKGCFTVIGSEGYSAGFIISPYDISAGFYYLQILTVGLLIFYAIVDHVSDDWRLGLIAIFSLVCLTWLYLTTINIQLPFSAQLGPMVAAFLLIGHILNKHNVAEFIENGYHERKYWLIFFSMLAIGLVFIAFFPSGMTMYNTKFGEHGAWSVFTFPILAMSCGMVLWYIAFFLTKVPVVSDFFIFAGMNSIVLFSQHMFVAKLMTAPFFDIGTEYWITVDSAYVRFTILLSTIALIFMYVHFMKDASDSLDENNLDEPYILNLEDER